MSLVLKATDRGLDIIKTDSFTVDFRLLFMFLSFIHFVWHKILQLEYIEMK